MRAIYKLANSSASLPILTTNIIRALFLNLKEDSLVFLASVVVRSHDVKGDTATCVAALRHAASFLMAQPNVDFQTILPSLIVAISGVDIGIRAAAVDCVAVMANDHKDLSVVYGFDTIYGEQSSNRLPFHRCYIYSSSPSPYQTTCSIWNLRMCRTMSNPSSNLRISLLKTEITSRYFINNISLVINLTRRQLRSAPFHIF